MQLTDETMMHHQKQENLKLSKSRFANRGYRGQIAIGFLVIMGFILLMVTSVTQLGQLAQVRVETSNASDAGALAAASWIVSGRNEGALIAKRMQESIDIVQAVLLVPFCPGQQQEDYANALINSLYQSPTNPGGCEMVRSDTDGIKEDIPLVGGREDISGFTTAGCGLNQYFEHLANGVMESAWNMGRREFLTAALNNMMIRYASSFDGGSDINADLIQGIQLTQDVLYNNTNASSWGIGYLSWHNGRLDANGDPVKDFFLYHQPVYSLINYPRNPPQIVMARHSFTFTQYVPGWTAKYYNCLDPVPGRGYEENPTTGPLADLELIWPLFGNQLPDRPLATDPSGLKQWQRIDLDIVLPLQNLNLKDCSELVCGLTSKTLTSVSEISPQAIQIVDSSGDPIKSPDTDINVIVSHRVSTSDGWCPGTPGCGPVPKVGPLDPPPPTRWPHLIDLPQFPPVTSESTVQMTSSQDVNPGLPDAQARIVLTK